jgi:hypothetical protein
MMVALGILVACGLMAAGIFGVRAETSPYAGMENRGPKALSEQQIEDLRGGRGMGMALAAELNGYPGPVHVIELARALDLSEAQRGRTQALFEVMRNTVRAAWQPGPGERGGSSTGPSRAAASMTRDCIVSWPTLAG